MSYGLCPICKQYRFTDSHHKCPPIWKCQIEEWNAPDWKQIYAQDAERAVEKFVEKYDMEDHELMSGGTIEVSVRSPEGKIEIYICNGEAIPTYYARIKERKDESAEKD